MDYELLHLHHHQIQALQASFHLLHHLCFPLHQVLVSPSKLPQFISEFWFYDMVEENLSLYLTLIKVTFIHSIPLIILLYKNQVEFASLQLDPQEQF